MAEKACSSPFCARCRRAMSGCVIAMKAAPYTKGSTDSIPGRGAFGSPITVRRSPLLPLFRTPADSVARDPGSQHPPVEPLQIPARAGALRPPSTCVPERTGDRRAVGQEAGEQVDAVDARPAEAAVAPVEA